MNHVPLSTFVNPHHTLLYYCSIRTLLVLASPNQRRAVSYINKYFPSEIREGEHGKERISNRLERNG